MVDLTFPEESDALHLLLSFSLCLLVATAILGGMFVNGHLSAHDQPVTRSVSTENASSHPASNQPRLSPAVILDNRTIEADASQSLASADLVVWVAADSQPSSNADFQRLDNGISDLNELTFTPDVSILAGDISDSYNSEDQSRNIRRTRNSYQQLRWFKSDKTGASVYVSGNHERESLETNEVAFGESCGDNRVVEDTSQNATLKIIGLCRAKKGSKPINNRTFRALSTRLSELQSDETNWTVFIAVHQPIPGTVSNCHGITSLSLEDREKYLNITRSHSEQVEATITGHMHGRWSDIGHSIVTTLNQTFIDAPVFGGGITYTGPDSNRCNMNGRGVADSLFIGVEYGAETATLHVRSSCDDIQNDGTCNSDGYWRRSIVIPLDRPIQPRR